VNADPLSLAFGALADPTRRGILARLSLGETSVSELAAPYAMSLPAISKHLKVLERAGLIARGREAQWRPCRLKAGPLQQIDAWIDHYRRFWDARFDDLEDYLREVQGKPRKRIRDANSLSSAPAARRPSVRTATKEKSRVGTKKNPRRRIR
jgi:DNA-binding transcriptional ArsR family regulator